MCTHVQLFVWSAVQLGHTRDYEGLKDDSLKCFDNFAINGFTSGKMIESGTAQMSGDSIFLDSDIGLFSKCQWGEEPPCVPALPLWASAALVHCKHKVVATIKGGGDVCR